MLLNDLTVAIATANIITLIPTEGSTTPLHYLSYTLTTLEGAAGHFSDFLISSTVSVNDHADESSDYPSNVMSNSQHFEAAL